MAVPPQLVSLRRATPTEETLTYRERYLASLQMLAPSEPVVGEAPGLETGNRKIGQTGSQYDSMFVWNLPAVSTCPGATAWCRRYCYNADPRVEVFPLERWMQNWLWVEQRPERLLTTILSQRGEIIPTQSIADSCSFPAPFDFRG